MFFRINISLLVLDFRYFHLEILENKEISYIFKFKYPKSKLINCRILTLDNMPTYDVFDIWNVL